MAEQPPNEPMNVLVLGSDSRENLTAEQKEEFGDTEAVPGRRADTIMLLHLDEQREKAVLIHFPRDLRVLDPEGEAVKINSIYWLGPDAMVETVSDFVGMPIHHYLEVDFNGFNEIADSVGGVEVYLRAGGEGPGLRARPAQGLRDHPGRPGSGVRPGPQDRRRLRPDPPPAAVHEADGRQDRHPRGGAAAGPGGLAGQRLLAAVKYDAELSLGDIKTIGLRLRKFNSGNLDMRVVPVGRGPAGRVSYVVANEKQSEALFAALASASHCPTTAAPASAPSTPRTSGSAS